MEPDDVLTSTTVTAPAGYRLLMPTERDVWQDGDLWYAWDGTWQLVSDWAQKPIRGIGARLMRGTGDSSR